MNKLGMLVGVIIVALLGGVVFVDTTSTPAPPAGQCVLAKRTFLPDACIATCTRGQASDCTATTRPYAIFFQQAATCDLGVICLP